MFGISLEDIIIVITNTNRITGVKNPHTGHKPIIKLERAMKCKSEKNIPDEHESHTHRHRIDYILRQ